MKKDLKKIIYNLETLLLKPEVRSSAKKIASLLSSDFIEFGSSGTIYYKKQILEKLPKDSKIFPVKFSVSNFKVKELGDGLALATFKIEKMLPDGKHIISLRTSIWRRNGKNWQIFFHQGTLVQ